MFLLRFLSRSGLFLVILFVQLGWSTIVHAHGGSTSTPQMYVQVVGSSEIAVLIKPVTRVPGPLDVEITGPHDVINTTLLLQATPTNESFSDSRQVKVRLIEGDVGPYFARLQVDRGGPWDLSLCLPEMPDSECSLIPFTVNVPATEPSVLLLYSAFALLGVFVFSGILTTLITGWLRKPISRRVLRIFGQGAIICLTIAVTMAAYMAFLPPASRSQAVDSPSTVTTGRPYINAELVTMPVQPVADQHLSLTLLLTDGSSGHLVDDLVPHHDALMHLIIVSEDGGFFRHTHPARLAPGRYQVSFTPDRPGLYQVALEIERLDSGSQMVMRTLTVGGHVQSSDRVSFPPLTARHLVEGIQTQITASRELVRVGEPVTLTFHLTRNGQPVKDIQPWLGMAGHLLMRGPDGMHLAHVHAVGVMPDQLPAHQQFADLFAEPGANSAESQPEKHFGPDIQFVYTFPRQGIYQAWLQFQHAHQIITVPFLVEVVAA